MKKKKAIKPPKRREGKFNQKLHLNTSFENALNVIAGNKKPAKNIVKLF